MKSMKTKSGSVLVISLIFGIIMLAGAYALFSTCLTEHRNTIRNQLNSIAFSLAESGIDKAADDILSGTISNWPTINSVCDRTFSVSASTVSGNSANYRVICAISENTYTVTSRGTVSNSGGAVTSTRTVQVIFTKVTATSAGKAGGLLTYGTMLFPGNENPNQLLTVDSYKSGTSRPGSAPNTSTNRYPNALVATYSNTANSLNIGYSAIYAAIQVGTQAATATQNTFYFSNNGKTGTNQDAYAKIYGETSTANVYDLIKATGTNVGRSTYTKPAITAGSAPLTDIIPTSATYTSVNTVIPPDADKKDGWVQVLPKDGSSQSQWKGSGTLDQYGRSDDTKGSVPQVYSAGNTISFGQTDTDKVYMVTSAINGGGYTFNISGEVILVVTDSNINDGKISKVNFMTDNSKLTIYIKSFAAVIPTTQQIGLSNITVQNYQANRLTINVIPSNTNFNFSSDEPTAIQAKIRNAIAAGGVGGDVTLNVNGGLFVGSINAPFSKVNIEGINYCGSLLAGSVKVSGNNAVKFHYDETLAGTISNAPTLLKTSWRELPQSSTIFAN